MSIYEPCKLNDEDMIGIVLGHADTEAYLNRPKKNRPKKNPRPKPNNHKESSRKGLLLLSHPTKLSEAAKMKREWLRRPCLRTSLVLSVFFSVAGIALLVVGTVMLSRPTSSSSPSSGNRNHQWMLILGPLIVFVAIASYLCLRNYCVYHVGGTPVKVLSVEGEELKDVQYELMKKTEKECSEGETGSHLMMKGKGSDPEVVSDEQNDQSAASGDDIPHHEIVLILEDEGQVDQASQRRPSNISFQYDQFGLHPNVDFQSDRRPSNRSNVSSQYDHLQRQFDVDFQGQRRPSNMSNISTVSSEYDHLDLHPEVDVQSQLRRMSKVSQV